MAVAGLRGSGEWGEGERPENYRETILWMEAAGDLALFALSSRATNKKKTVDDTRFHWWAEPMELVRLQVNGVVAAGETLITVDSGDPTAANIKQHYGKATHLKPGDVLMVEPAADAASDTAERLIVTQVHSDTQFSVNRGFSGTTPAEIANDRFLLLVGSAYAEGTTTPEATTRNPVKYDNITQIFKTSYELTGTAKEINLRTGDPLKNDRKRKFFDHGRSIEMGLWWSKKSEVVGANGKPLRTMGGLREFIPAANTKVLTNGWGLYNVAGNNLLDAISPVFDYSTPAGDTRMAFCGNGTLNRLNVAIAESSGSSGVQIYWGGSEKVYGMNFRELIFPQGRVLVKTHPLMSRHPIYNYSMWLLDFSCITYVALRNRDTKARDEIQNKDEDLVRGEWMTECSLMVDYGGQSLGYIGGFNTTVA